MRFKEPSNAHERMIIQLAEYERENELINELYRVFGDQADDYLYKIEDLFKQFNINTATWGLDIWELNLDILTRGQLTYEERRAIIKTKLKQRGKVSTLTLQSLLQDYFIENVEVEFDGRLIFNMPLEGSSLKLYQQARQVIHRTKPAHLGYEINIYLKTVESDIYFGTASRFGEDITIYPRMPREIDEVSDIFASLSYESIGEEITIGRLREHGV